MSRRRAFLRLSGQRFTSAAFVSAHARRLPIGGDMVTRNEAGGTPGLDAIAVIAFLALAARGEAAQSYPELEGNKSGIDKIVQLTAKEHSTIVFTVSDTLIGYARDGRLEWINEHSPSSPQCGWSHPTLSHDGWRIAFVEASETRGLCRIVVFDASKRTRHELIETRSDPGEISWSWDDSEVVFYDGGISAISVNSMATRRLWSFPPQLAGRPLEFWVWYPMQLLRHGDDLIIEAVSGQSHLISIIGGEARVLALGSRPAVSPALDRIAYQAADGIVAINPDGTARTVLTKAPRALGLFKEDFVGKMTWSSDGRRLFFGTMVSENRHDNVYLLNVQTRRRELFQSDTSIVIRGWR